MWGQLIYDTELMDNISEKFRDGADKIDSAIAYFNGVSASFPVYYEGQVSDEIYDSFADTMVNHLKLLKQCYECMDTYVEDTKNEMVAADQSRANSIWGGGPHSGGGGSHSGGAHSGGGGGHSF